VLEGLVAFDRELKPIPALAERWQNPDARTWVFDLRPNARFSDGRPVRADDVTASLQAAMSKGWVNGSYLRLASVRPLSPLQVEVRTSRSDPMLLYRLRWGYVLAAGGLDAEPVPVVGTGPYRLERWDPGREFVLSRDPYYHGRAPDFETVRFRVIPSQQERLAAVVRGDADIADHAPLG